MPATPVLSAAHLSAGYGTRIIVDDLSFTLERGKILTLIGANGAGKSTVLRTICAQLPAAGGTILLGGKPLSALRETQIAREMAVLLTERLRSERMNCEEVVETGRYPYTGRFGLLSAHDHTIVAEAMELAGISHLRTADFRQISDGQRQCVMLARAIAQEPAVMLLDEPTSFLDIRHKLRLLTLLRELVREKQIAVVQSLHELDLAQKFSDLLLCIRNGRADRLGTPETVFAGDYIARLYDLPPESYNTLYGVAEPPAVQGAPEVFVIGGGGSGIPVYRQLAREGIPFAAGVLHENDVDCPAAAALASAVITERAYEPIGEDALRRAQNTLLQCRRVICTLSHFGSMNCGNRRLLEAARAAGLPVQDASA